MAGQHLNNNQGWSTPYLRIRDDHKVQVMHSAMPGQNTRPETLYSRTATVRSEMYIYDESAATPQPNQRLNFDHNHFRSRSVYEEDRDYQTRDRLEGQSKKTVENLLEKLMLESPELLFTNPPLLKALVCVSSEPVKSNPETDNHCCIQPTVTKVKEFSGKGKPISAKMYLKGIQDMEKLFKWEQETILKAAVMGFVTSRKYSNF